MSSVLQYMKGGYLLILGVVLGFMACLLWLAATLNSCPNGYALFGLLGF